MKNISIVFRFILVPFLCVQCSKQEERKSDSVTKFCVSQELKKNFKTEIVNRLPIEESITLTGEVESNSDKTVPYVSLVDGVVTETFFALGDYVKKGQLLANVKSVSVNEMQGDTQNLRSQLAVAKRKLASVESMYKDGIASQKDLLEAKSEVDILQSDISKINKNLQLYSAGQNNFAIKSPAEGYVIEKNISAGMPVNAGGEQLFKISNLDKVWVMANVYATNMRHVFVGQEVTVKTLAYPDESFTGKIDAISQVFNENERVLKAKIVMDNHQMKLRPGMSADIVLPIKTDGRAALAVSPRSLVFDNNQTYILTYKNDCDVSIKPVFEIANNGKYSYIEGALKSGEKVVASNALLIYENLKNNSK